MFEDDYKNGDYYNDIDRGDEDEFNGFSIIDDSGLDITHLQKIVREAEEKEEPTIATPVPENESTVIIDVTALILPDVGDELTPVFNADNGGVFKDGTEIGRFKRAFIKRLYETRGGKFARAFLHADSSPVMVKLVFSDTEGTAIPLPASTD